LVVGVHQSTDAYPNTLYRVRELRERFGAREVNESLWSTPTGGWASAESPLRMLWRAIVLHARLVKSVVRMPRFDVAYIPYPAPSVMLALSLLPRRWRPSHIVLDGFISLYDTIVNDRKLLRAGALPSRILRMLERRAFARADKVLVDTPQNAAFYASEFGLPLGKFEALPLATNETGYSSDPYQPAPGPCRVLFMGTLVPLHGISTIAEAMKLLSTRTDIEFRILGNGIDAGILRSVVEGLPNVDWQQRWHSTEELALAIREADICLGIFGNTAKTQRVCPYKLYSYASVGRATITGDTDWLRSISAAGGASPFGCVSVGDPHALAGAIRALADDPGERVRLAVAARHFYESRLANAVSMESLMQILFAGGPGRD
jgi:glycosyltransferase involved in cell wall biosynthesis